MEDFISYSKIAELLTKALRDELTDEETGSVGAVET